MKGFFYELHVISCYFCRDGSIDYQFGEKVTWRVFLPKFKIHVFCCGKKKYIVD
jgi:hypothetical protein